MNDEEVREFYIITRILRDIDDGMIAEILELEGLQVETATMLECKQAIIRNQRFVETSDCGEWRLMDGALARTARDQHMN